MQLVIAAELIDKYRAHGVGKPRMRDPSTIVAIIKFELLVLGDLIEYLFILTGIFTRNKRRHTAHCERAPFVAGIYQ